MSHQCMTPFGADCIIYQHELAQYRRDSKHALKQLRRFRTRRMLGWATWSTRRFGRFIPSIISGIGIAALTVQLYA